MKILITGGLGFIGSNLVAKLINDNHEIYVIDNISEQIHNKSEITTKKNQYCNYDFADIRDINAVKKIFLKKIDVLIHLAAETGTGQSMYKVESYVSVNEYGTSVLIQAMIDTGIFPQKIILASSRSVYGEGAYIDDNCHIVQPSARKREDLENGKWDFKTDSSFLKPIPTPEDLPYDPKSIYAVTKVAQELLLKVFCETYRIPLTILRLQNVYGEGQSLKNPYTGIISIFFNKARQGIFIPLYEDGLSVRDFVYIDDVIAAIVISIRTNNSAIQSYNIGTGKAVTVYELAAKINKLSGNKAEIIVTGQYRLGDIRYCIADTNKAETNLGFVAKTNLDDGLENFARWAIYENIYSDLSSNAEQELKQYGIS